MVLTLFDTQILTLAKPKEKNMVKSKTKTKTRPALIQIDAALLPEINAYCAKVKRQTGAIKRHVIGSLLLEAIRRDTANVSTN